MTHRFKVGDLVMRTHHPEGESHEIWKEVGLGPHKVKFVTDNGDILLHETRSLIWMECYFEHHEQEINLEDFL